MTSCRLQSNYSSTVTLHGGPVRLRLVRVTFCLVLCSVPGPSNACTCQKTPGLLVQICHTEDVDSTDARTNEKGWSQVAGHFGHCSELPRMRPCLVSVGRYHVSHGNLSVIVVGVWNKRMPVAIKTLKVGTMEPLKFLEEAEIMKQLHHPKIVALYAVCSREEPIYIVTELMSHGSLLTCLRDEKQREFLDWNKLIDIAAQVWHKMISDIICRMFTMVRLRRMQYVLKMWVTATDKVAFSGRGHTAFSLSVSLSEIVNPNFQVRSQ